MLEGIITKGIGGFYYVMTEKGLIESRARGVFREENITPLIGDKVRIRISDEDETGYIEEIHPRTSELVRPPVANITQLIVVMSIKKPKLNTWLLDRFTMMAEEEGLKLLICINKSDLDEKKSNEIKEIYELAGYRVLKTSVLEDLNIDLLEKEMLGEISVLAGPSGVGKSSILNAIKEDFKLETGDISKKTERGRHTTRHVELLNIDENSYVLDTPGFSSLDLSFIENEIVVRDYFKEIKKAGEGCRFQSCLHRNEPNCNVKSKVEEGKISKSRYKNYLKVLEEVENIKRY